MPELGIKVAEALQAETLMGWHAVRRRARQAAAAAVQKLAAWPPPQMTDLPSTLAGTPHTRRIP